MSERLFFAGDLSDELRETLRVALLPHRDSGARFGNLAKLHLTLAFLGNVEEARIPSLVALGQEVAKRHRRFSLNARGAGTFGRPRSPSVLWAGLDDSEPLRALQADLATGVRALGFELEDRPFRAHLTLARAKHPKEGRALASVAEALSSSAFGAFDVDEVLLLSSKPQAGGHVYTPRGTFTLGGAAPQTNR